MKKVIAHEGTEENRVKIEKLISQNTTKKDLFSKLFGNFIELIVQGDLTKLTIFIKLITLRDNMAKATNICIVRENFLFGVHKYEILQCKKNTFFA